jgi:hypothetical protein
MKYISKITLTLIATIFIFSCSKEDSSLTNSELKADTETIAKLIDGFDKTLKYSQTEGVKNDELTLSNYFLETTKANGIDVIKNSAFAKSTENQYSEEFEIFSTQITNASSFSSKAEYLDNLSETDLLVNDSQLSIEEKQILINKIAFMNAFVDWTDTLAISNSNKSPAMAKSDCDGWWSCWGKCVAGTVGSAVVGAGTLGLAGAAVGTVVLPVIGTVSAGAVGAIVGGVGGALTGAATFC